MAQEGGALFAGSICQTASLYSSGAGKKVVQEKFKEQIEIFLQNNVDLLIAEVNILQTASASIMYHVIMQYSWKCD